MITINKQIRNHLYNISDILSTINIKTIGYKYITYFNLENGKKIKEDLHNFCEAHSNRFYCENIEKI